MGYDINSSNWTGNYDNLTDEEMYQAAKENGDQARFNSTAWPILLRMAEFYGWKPSGTKCPVIYNTENGSYDEYKDWDGSYLGNNGQKVTDEDAIALATALEKSLDDIPDVETCEKTASYPLGQDSIYDNLGIDTDMSGGMVDDEIRIIRPNRDLSPYDFFSGEEYKHKIRNFITLCRKGAFCIH
jgi:hypothetical protein